MLVNDVLERSLGLRIVRESTMRAFGLFTRRDDTQKLNEKAEQALLAFEHFNGKTLSPANRRRADDYAVAVLGSLEYAPWLRAYAVMRGEFLEGWIPENYYHLEVVPKIIKGLANLSTMKSFSNRLLKTEALPDIAYHIDGIFYDRDYRAISRGAMIELAKPHGVVFVKGDGGGRGTNIRKVAAQALADLAFDGDCAIQKPILQHAFFDEFMTESLATLRITTLKTPSGAIEMRGARLRIGRAGTDWLISEKGLSVVVMDDRGTLDDHGYTADFRGWLGHPDTGTAFSGRRIPAFADAVEFCKALHAAQPHFAIVGWDVAINREGKVELIEWNVGHAGVSFQEAISGPHFKDMGWERFARKARK